MRRYLDIIVFIAIVFLKVCYFNYFTISSIGKVSTFSLGITFATITIAGTFVGFFKGKLRVLVIIFFDFIFTLLILVDLLYWRYFNEMLSLQSTLGLDQAKALKLSLVIGLSAKSDIFLILDFLMWIFLFFTVRKKGKPVKERFKVRKVLLFLLSIAFVFFMLSYYSINHKPITIMTERVLQLGVLNYHAYDIYCYSSSSMNTTEVGSTEVIESAKWIKENTSVSTNNEFFGIAKGKNVILIQSESLLNFLVDFKYNGQEITPNLNKLASESLYFDDCYGQTCYGNTADAEFITLTSLYPPLKGIPYIYYPQYKYSSLPTILKDNGYKTSSFHGYESFFYNRNVVHPNMGFDNSTFQDGFVNDESIGWGLSDESFFRQTLQKLEATDQPFLSFLITLTNHYPFDELSLEQKGLLDVGELSGSLLGNYLHSAHFTDIALGHFIESLKNSELYNNSIIILYGDHGFPYKIDEFRKIMDIPNEALLNQKLTKVPLIIHLPNEEKIQRYSFKCGQIDTAPTILHLLGIKPSNHYFLGNNLLSGESYNYVSLPFKSFVDGDYYYTNSSGVFDTGKAYNIKTGEEVPVEGFREKYLYSMKRFQVSDSIFFGVFGKGLDQTSPRTRPK